MSQQNSENLERLQFLPEAVLSFLLSHREKLQRVAGHFLLRVTDQGGEELLFLITPSDIILKSESATDSPELPEITVDIQTLRKVLENPQRALRFYFQGKIRIKGDPKDLFIL